MTGPKGLHPIQPVDGRPWLWECRDEGVPPWKKRLRNMPGVANDGVRGVLIVPEEVLLWLAKQENG